jgi:hypothetical protein
MAPRLARAALAAVLLALAAAGLPLAPASLGPPRALAEEDWRGEFDAICARTEEAMALPVEELRALMARCDALAPRLRSLDESTRKVFGRRLQQCRDLFRYVVESRQRGS